MLLRVNVVLEQDLSLPEAESEDSGGRVYLAAGDGLAETYGQWQIDAQVVMPFPPHVHARPHTSFLHHSFPEPPNQPAPPHRLTAHPALTTFPSALAQLGNVGTSNWCETFVLSGRDKWGYYADGIASRYQAGPDAGGSHRLPEIDVIETYWGSGPAGSCRHPQRFSSFWHSISGRGQRPGGSVGCWRHTTVSSLNGLWITAGVRITPSGFILYNCIKDDCEASWKTYTVNAQSGRTIGDYGFDQMHGWVPTISTWHPRPSGNPTSGLGEPNYWANYLYSSDISGGLSMTSADILNPAPPSPPPAPPPPSPPPPSPPPSPPPPSPPPRRPLQSPRLSERAWARGWRQRVSFL